MDDDFDPDAYLAESGDDFDPDEYLSENESFSDKAKNFGESMALGSSIGENLPLIGKPLARAGTMIGSGIQAATEAPFSDASISDLYKRNMALSDQAEAEQAAYDKRSPAAGAVKSGLAGLAVAPLKRPMPTGGESAQFSYPKDTMKEKLMEYFKRQGNIPAKGGGTLQKAMPFIKEQAEELLPYPARAALRGYRRFKGK